MATIEKHGPSWRVRLDALPDGRRPSKTFRTQAEARAWLREYQAGELADPSEATLAQVLRRYAAEVSPGHKGERWEVVRLNKLARHPMAATPIQKLTTAALAAWRDERLKQVAPASVRGSQPSSAPTIDRDEPSKGAACRSARARPLAAQGSPMAQALLPTRKEAFEAIRGSSSSADSSIHPQLRPGDRPRLCLRAVDSRHRLRPLKAEAFR